MWVMNVFEYDSNIRLSGRDYFFELSFSFRSKYSGIRCQGRKLVSSKFWLAFFVECFYTFFSYNISCHNWNFWIYRFNHLQCFNHFLLMPMSCIDNYDINTRINQCLCASKSIIPNTSCSTNLDASTCT